MLGSPCARSRGRLTLPSAVNHGLGVLARNIEDNPENMVLAVPPDQWPALKKLCDDEDVEATAIGTYTSDQMLRLRYNGTQVGESVSDSELPARLVEVKADDRQEWQRGDRGEEHDVGWSIGPLAGKPDDEVDQRECADRSG